DAVPLAPVRRGDLHRGQRPLRSPDPGNDRSRGSLLGGTRGAGDRGPRAERLPDGVPAADGGHHAGSGVPTIRTPVFNGIPVALRSAFGLPLANQSAPVP